jgi:hypothetical protein
LGSCDLEIVGQSRRTGYARGEPLTNTSSNVGGDADRCNPQDRRRDPKQEKIAIQDLS